MAEPLKVLLLAGRFEVRASCAYTLRLLEHLGDHGIQSLMVCSDAARIDPERRAALPIHEYRRFERPLWGRVVLEGIRRNWQDSPPDVIHLQSPAVYGAGLWLARRWGRPMVMTVARTLSSRTRFSEVGGRCRRVIAISQSVADDLVRRNRIPAKYVEVIHSGVEVPGRDREEGVLEAGQGPVVGTAGPLEATKGLPFFLGAAARVVRECADCEFLVSGAGPEEHNLRRLARNLKLSGHVTFVSQLYDFEMSLEAMDIFCLPSLQQGLGVTMLEAMVRGRPVIATSVGGVDNIITDGLTGLNVPPSDSQQLADRILELLRDPERARTIGQAGQKFVLEEFGVGQMVEKTAATYRGLVPAGVAA